MEVTQAEKEIVHLIHQYLDLFHHGSGSLDLREWTQDMITDIFLQTWIKKEGRMVRLQINHLHYGVQYLMKQNHFTE